MGQVTLVHCTPEAERLIAQMARVSNPANKENHETAPRLLRYLVKHKHWSPFEMASMCVQIETQRDIAAQILRHRSFSFQEFSTRYATVQGPAVPALRRQDSTNRQNSIDDLPAALKIEMLDRIGWLYGESSKLYNDMLEAGVAKECARRIMPLSTRTTLYMHGTLRSWIHYIELRTEAGTQLEHRAVALECAAIFKQNFPSIYEAAFSNNG
jgi:thymidylate synthase (FAD)